MRWVFSRVAARSSEVERLFACRHAARALNIQRTESDKELIIMAVVQIFG